MTFAVRSVIFSSSIQPQGCIREKKNVGEVVLTSLNNERNLRMWYVQFQIILNNPLGGTVQDQHRRWEGPPKYHTFNTRFPHICQILQEPALPSLGQVRYSWPTFDYLFWSYFKYQQICITKIFRALGPGWQWTWDDIDPHTSGGRENEIRHK